MEIKTLPLKPNGHQISNYDEVEVFNFDERGPFVPSRALIFPECAVCGSRPELLVGDDAVRAQDPCPYPDGITTTVTVAFTSGKIIVTDELRPVYDWEGETTASYNSALGRDQAIRAMAFFGCAYGPVGNTCPGLYRTAPGKYIIASPEWIDDDEDNQSPPQETCLAGICTDLWAYSIADFEDWKSRGGDPESLKRTASVVDFPPGVYQFTHHTGERGFDHHAGGTVVFAHIERIG
jgi:hypothetical protein